MDQPLRCYFVHLFIWIMTAVSGTILPNLKPKVLEEANSGCEDIPHPLTRSQVLLDTISPCLAETFIPAHSLNPPERSYPHALSRSRLPDPAGPSSSPSPHPISTTHVFQEIPASSQAPAAKRKCQQISMNSSPSSSSTTSTSSDNSIRKRPKQEQFDPFELVNGKRAGYSNLNHLDAGQLATTQRGPKRGSYVLKLNRPKQPNSLYFTPGLIYLSFIKKAYDRFEAKLASLTLDVTQLRNKLQHPLEMINMHWSFDRPDKVVRVKHSSTEAVQSFTNWKTLYRVLIGWIYERHEKLMNNSNLPTYVQRFQHEKLISWLDQQIFSPPTGLPIMGRIDVPNELSWRNHRFPLIQLQLIKYFAHDVDMNLLAPTTALSVIAAFQTQYDSDYVASRYFLEASTRISTSPEFQMLRSFLINSLGPEQRQTLAQHGSFGTKDPIFQSTFKRFNDNLAATSLRKLEVKSFHPKLPIAMYFVDKKSDRLPFRVLSREDRSAIKNRVFNSMFKRLAKAMKIFHLEILSRLDIKTPETILTRTEEMLQWLLKSIIEPTDSLCVIGHARINGDFAPWEDITNGALSLYGQAQLELIDYFSTRFSNPILESSAVFILSLWYKYYHPKEFNFLAALSHEHHSSLATQEANQNV
ncbi:hypothetical protein PGT21_007254 [Puccinia graminis f. sp. tritici]|uniref:Uncharacterized protein n=1 Tax=Puccinia graminis f. sp. tritici TaxID=56615 RepID=A0A5B0SKM0_PUCGR|nr:hypothetical protein PGT21_007254 [Puccinia graminis f. sp. tritici]KAA1137723.1 hypothetical protein PGTUg99_006552 [Puccinia graminis f. sp. tritici]